jgi:SAM-dependent methyltransferase
VSSLRAAVARRAQSFAPGRQFRLDLARRTLHEFAAGRAVRVLDAGCEDGLLAATLARENPTWTVVGGDINDEALAKARASAVQSGLSNVDFVHLDVTKPFAEGEYDAVAAVECLAEIPDDRAAVHSFARALRVGGLLVVHVPERDWRPVLSSSPKTWKREARHGYAAEELRKLLEDAAFEGIELRKTTRATLHMAEEVRARTRTSRLRMRAFAYPFLATALRLEQLGVTGGDARALFASARKRSLDDPA